MLGWPVKTVLLCVGSGLGRAQAQQQDRTQGYAVAHSRRVCFRDVPSDWRQQRGHTKLQQVERTCTHSGSGAVFRIRQRNHARDDPIELHPVLQEL